MSIKDLFDKPERLLSQDSEEITSEIESVEYISVKNEKDKTFIPDVDFSDPKNFARFGLAEEYYRQIMPLIKSMIDDYIDIVNKYFDSGVGQLPVSYDAKPSHYMQDFRKALLATAVKWNKIFERKKYRTREQTCCIRRKIK